MFGEAVSAVCELVFFVVIGLNIIVYPISTYGLVISGVSTVCVITRLVTILNIIAEARESMPKKRITRRKKNIKSTGHRLFAGVITELLCVSAIYVLITNGITVPPYIITIVLLVGAIISLIF